MITDQPEVTMKKRVAFFNPHTWSPHLETDLELIHKHISAGDDVTVYICSGELPTCSSQVHPSCPTFEVQACSAGAPTTFNVCNQCIFRRRNALNLTELADRIHLQSFLNLDTPDLETLKGFQGVNIHTIDELLAIRIDNCLIGKAIYKELMSLQCESEPDLVAASEYLTRSIETAALVYLSFKNHFAETHPDIFYTFNGRFVAPNAAIEAAVACGVPCAVHDRAPGAMNQYAVVVNESLHSLTYWKHQIQTFWEQSRQSIQERESAAEKWFEARANKQKQQWHSFIEEQTNELPESFDRNKTNVVIFNSSAWEFAGIDDYQLFFYETQDDALLRLARDLQQRSELRIYLRVHPHLKNQVSSQTAFIANELTQRFPNFEVIPPESPVSTYQLMKNADLVITFGSTAGIEAAYYGVPSLLLGPTWYDNLDACSVTGSHAETIDFIVAQRFKLTSGEQSRRKANAAKYGYFRQEYGIPFQIFEQTDVFEMKYRGSNSCGATISADPPGYELGLKKELERRLELTAGSRLNPLLSTVQELVLHIEAKQLQVDALHAQLQLKEQELQEVKHSLSWRLTHCLREFKARILGMRITTGKMIGSTLQALNKVKIFSLLLQKAAGCAPLRHVLGRFLQHCPRQKEQLNDMTTKSGKKKALL